MTLGTPRPPRWWTVAFVLLGFLAGAPGAAAASEEPGIRRFELSSGEAAVRLKQFGQQAGREILFPAGAVTGVTTNRVSGELTPRAALGQLLAGTGLTSAEDVQTGAIIIFRPAAAQPASPVEATETGSAQPNSPDSRDRKSTRLNSSHSQQSRMPSSA